MYSSETMLWKVKERSKIRAVQVDNLKGLKSLSILLVVRK